MTKFIISLRDGEWQELDEDPITVFELEDEQADEFKVHYWSGGDPRHFLDTHGIPRRQLSAVKDTLRETKLHRTT